MNSTSAGKRRYDLKNYDSILTKWPKGAKERLKALAEAEGVSVSRYIMEAVEQRSGQKFTLDGVLPWQREKQD